MNKVDFKTIFPDSIDKFHHAYCLEGARESILNGLSVFLENDLNFKIKSNPDLYFGDFDALGIDEGRSINEMQSRKSLSSLRRIFIIAANFITKEAQNSLLKMFEDPSGGAVFFLIIPSAGILLSTLRSRMMVLNLNRSENQYDNHITVSNAKTFIKSSVAQRLAAVKKMVDKIADKEESRSVAIDFLNSIEREISNESAEAKDLKIKNLFIFEELDKCRNYAGDRSPSIKIILEHMAVMI